MRTFRPETVCEARGRLIFVIKMIRYYIKRRLLGIVDGAGVSANGAFSELERAAIKTKGFRIDVV